VSFVVSQIGDNEGSKDFLKKLDDSQKLGDSVYVAKEEINEGFSNLNQNDDELELQVRPRLEHTLSYISRTAKLTVWCIAL
jgi:hypothetical protein